MVRVAVYVSPRGLAATSQPVDQAHRGFGGVAGPLGFPVADIGSDDGQEFVGGLVHLEGTDEAPSAVAVTAPVFDLTRTRRARRRSVRR